MKKRVVVFLVGLLGIFSFAFIVDEDPITAILKKLEAYTKKFPQEKIHLHLDKPYYMAGEDVWLKGYLVTAEKNEPSNISKILYVELINPAHEIVKKITLAVDSGRSIGQFTIPDTVAGGNYSIRAYTNYMRNYDADFFFEKFLPIVNLRIAQPTSVIAQKPTLIAQFFPEGGSLVHGLRSKVGVKILNQDGIGVNAEGDVTDQTGKKIATFATEHAGIGSFAITPTKGEIYSVNIKKPDGSIMIFSLPKIEEKGYIMSVNSFGDKDNVMVKIAASETKGQSLTLVGQVNGITYFTSAPAINQGVVLANIPKMRFPTGIVQFTLFENAVPVIERLAFINHHNQIKIDVAQAKNSSPNLTTLNFNITDENNNPLDGNFSVSVTDASKVLFNEDNEVGMLANLLLTSDLKGFIEQPNYYFNNTTPEKEQQLDNLLLTQGWRRFSWSNILSDKETKLTYPIEESLAISGSITNEYGKAMANAKVILMSVSPNFDLVLDTLTDARGKFTFDRLDVPDTAQFIVQAKDGKDNSSYKIVMDAEQPSSKKVYVGNSVNMEAYVSNAKTRSQQRGPDHFKSDGIKLNQVNVVKKTDLKPIVNVANSKSRNGSVDYVVSKDRIEHETGNAFQLLTNAPGVKLSEGKIVRAMTNTTSMAPNFKGKVQPAIIILDGAKVDQDVLLMTPASTIEGVEILVSNYNTAIYEDGYWGVIIITTKMGVETDVSKLKTFHTQKVLNKGFSLVKSFYEPPIAADKTAKAILKNPQVSTVYWNPNVNSNTYGKAKVNFQNIGTGNYRVVIEGMDNLGNFGRKTYNFELKDESTTN